MMTDGQKAMKKLKKAIEAARFRRAYKALYEYRINPDRFASMAGLPENEAWEKLRRVRRVMVGCQGKSDST